MAETRLDMFKRLIREAKDDLKFLESQPFPNRPAINGIKAEIRRYEAKIREITGQP